MKYIGRFVEQPRLRLAWLLAVGRNSWWIMYFVYMPIQLKASGFSDEMTGAIVSAGLAPLFLIRVWAKIGRAYGIRPLLMVGYGAAGSANRKIRHHMPLRLYALQITSIFGAEKMNRLAVFIDAGEATGSLAPILANLVELIDARRRMRKEILSGLASCFSDEALCQNLRSATTSQELYDRLTGWQVTSQPS